MDEATELALLRKKFQELSMQHESLQAETQRLKQESERYQSLSEQLQEELTLLRGKLFGRKADSVSLESLSLNLEMLFDEAEVTELIEQECAIRIPSHTRKKKGRQSLSAELPRVTQIIDIPSEQKICECGAHRQVIGNEKSEKLIHIPAVFYVLEQIRPKYACHVCEGSADEELPAVIVAEPAVSILPKSQATASVLATVITQKFEDHLPYYRQQQIFSRASLTISRQNMSNWQIKSYEQLAPLMKLLDEELYRTDVLHMDETSVQVLKEPQRKPTQKSYMWLIRGGPEEHPVIRYQYNPSRGAEYAKQLLQPFSGYLMTDGYVGYDTATEKRADIIQVNCWAHARRYFSDAAKASKKPQAALEGVKWIKKLYSLEKELREKLAAGALDVETFQSERAEKATKIFEGFQKWLENKKTVVPSSLLGKAVSYSNSRWDRLIKYIEHPRLTPDNNSSERCIKPFVLGRKNWLFSGSVDGVQSSCGYYSLIQTAKEQGLNPHVYLFYIFEKAPYCKTTEDWEALLPWNVEIPKVLDIQYINSVMGL